MPRIWAKQSEVRADSYKFDAFESICPNKSIDYSKLISCFYNTAVINNRHLNNDPFESTINSKQ